MMDGTEVAALEAEYSSATLTNAIDGSEVFIPDYDANVRQYQHHRRDNLGRGRRFAEDVGTISRHVARKTNQGVYSCLWNITGWAGGILIIIIYLVSNIDPRLVELIYGK
jgi:hypothetical protein